MTTKEDQQRKKQCEEAARRREAAKEGLSKPNAVTMIRKLLCSKNTFEMQVVPEPLMARLPPQLRQAIAADDPEAMVASLLLLTEGERRHLARLI